MAHSDPKTKIELEEALNTIILRAYENGVSINDVAIELRHTPPKTPDWELMIYQLQSDTSDRSHA